MNASEAEVPTRSGLPRSRWEIRPERRAAQDLRRAATTWIEQQGLLSGDAALVIAELLANAVRAASNEIVLELAVHRGSLQVTVTDDGPGLQALPNVRLPSWEAEGSRGLFLVHELAQDVRLTSAKLGTSVTCRLVNPAG